MDNLEENRFQNCTATDSYPDFLYYPSQDKAIEDIDHPAWISSSFSESCGSCMSKVSSLCLDDKNKDSLEFTSLKLVSEESAGTPEESKGASHIEGTLEKNNCVYHTDENAFAMSGSYPSLSSSSKTIYASPRSDSDNVIFCALNKSLKGQKINKRRGSLYRERAPSENALDFNNLSFTRTSKLSHSLHDVSSIPSNGLKNPSCKTGRTGVSLSALHSRNRSKDSGFIRSESLLSVSSGSRNYDHVESKVKLYIQNIKNADAIRKRERAEYRDSTSSESYKDICVSPVDPDLMTLVQKMKYDLDEKDRLLLRFQEDYNRLLGKYAEAENKIDKLRFSWYGSTSSPPQAKSQPANTSTLRQQQQSDDVDSCSLNSSALLSSFRCQGSPDSSVLFQNENKNKIPQDRNRKEVVISAPLRPISSLYCSSARLDKVMTPLNSKSSVGGSSEDPKSIIKMKSRADNGIQDVNITDGTIDRGIESCCPLSTQDLSATCRSHKSEPVGHLPHEDPILKVQRWQESLPASSQPTSQSSFVSENRCKGRSHMTSNIFLSVAPQHNHDEPFSTKSEVVSIGIQVKELGNSEIPSLSSEMSTPMVPCLNLEGLSTECTDDFSGSMPISEVQKTKPISSGCSSSNINSSSGLGQSNCSMPFKSRSSNLETSTPSKHICEGICKVCGCKVKSGSKHGRSQEEGRKMKSRSPSFRRHQNLHLVSNQKGSFSSQMSKSELSKLLRLIRQKDQDHVVPASPEEERSFEDAFRILEGKIKSLQSVVGLPTLTKLLDLLLEKALSKECVYYNTLLKEGFTESEIYQVSDTPAAPEYSEDSSLLQCLEELDEYTNQVWAKTESFLEVLNSKKYYSSLKPE